MYLVKPNTAYMVLACGRCGARVENYSKYCSQCGIDLRPLKTCKQCGACIGGINPEYCMSCGSKVY